MKLRRALFGALLCALGFVVPAGAGLVTQSGPRLFVSESGHWQLDEGDYGVSDLPLSMVYPRPDADTQSWAYHRLIPDGTERVVPIVTLGGCQPVFATINDAPPGSTVNNDYYETPGEALALTIPAQSIGSYDVDITVHDQCETTLNPTWAVEVEDADDTDFFVHLDSAAGSGGDGTSGSPLDSLSDVLGPNSGATTWQNRQVLVCGTHILSGQSASYNANNSRLRINANKPHVWVACPGGATFQGSATNENGASFQSEAGSDFALVNIEWENPLVDEVAGDGGARNAFIHGLGLYSLVYGNTFTGTSDPAGATGGSNPAAVFIDTGVATDIYAAIVGNTFVDVDDMQFIMVFNASYLGIMANLSTGSAATEGYFLKGGGSITNVGTYFNVNTGGGGPFSTIQSINGATSWTRTNLDYMFNRHVSSSYCLRLRGSSADDEYGVYSRRNSWKCDHHVFEASNVVGGEFIMEWDSFEHDGTQTSPVPGVDDQGAGATIDQNDLDIGTTGILDDTTGLQESTQDCAVSAQVCPP